MIKRTTLLFVFLGLAMLMAACAASVGDENDASSSEDQVATIVAGTMQALTSSAPEATPESAANSDELLPLSFYYLGKDDAGLMQVFRIERDGSTTSQLTFEPVDVKSYDVSQVDGSVAYISNNQLLWADASGSSRRLLVDGGPVDQNNPFVSRLSNPVFSPDGLTIAYSYRGLNFYSLASGASNLVIENQLEDTGNGFIFPKELYAPARYSPDGTKLLVTLGYYEGASSAIYNLAGGTLVRLNGGEGALICCGREVWTADSSTFYSASATTGMFVAGLWKVDASSGQVTTLLISSYEGNIFNYVSYPYPAPDGQLYYFFFTSSSELNQRTPLQLARSAPDGLTGREILRPNTFDFMNDALWSPDASFVVTAMGQTQDTYFGGQAEVTYLDGRPSVILTSFAQDMKWGP
ncbi:MAG TPA: hypothetical protein VLA72_22980 [Anaerolineales bacterium]|nr:hypothetical protein [Anaerolineales bacterium]